MSTTGKKRGRPSKKVSTPNVSFEVSTVKMNNLSFNKNLFEPMKTNTKIDEFLSSDRGLMPGVNFVFTGDPGVGKTTVLLDILADLYNNGHKCLFISGEMNAIDMVGYVNRYPKFGELDILFMGDYADSNPDLVLRTVLKKGYDVVLVDSMVEISDTYTDYFGGTNKSNQNRLLQLFEEHNLGHNETKTNTAFLIVQQVTKSGLFAGANKLKHMTTGMFHLKVEETGGRYLYYSKNRRGGNANKLYFSLMNQGKVEYLHEATFGEE